MVAESDLRMSARKPRARPAIVVASVAILVGTEVFGLALATAWAVGGLLELGASVTYAIGAGLVAVGAYVTVPFVRRVWRVAAEPGTTDRRS